MLQSRRFSRRTLLVKKEQKLPWSTRCTLNHTTRLTEAFSIYRIIKNLPRLKMGMAQAPIQIK